MRHWLVSTCALLVFCLTTADTVKAHSYRPSFYEPVVSTVYYVSPGGEVTFYPSYKADYSYYPAMYSYHWRYSESYFGYSPRPYGSFGPPPYERAGK